MAATNITTGDLLTARILILAPHMDDEVLGCGGTMLMHQDKTRLHCVYATDGARSPAPLLPWTGSIDPHLSQCRRREACDAMNQVGVPRENLVFFDFPDGALSYQRRELTCKLNDVICNVEPEIILTPFRYDLHADHIAVTRCVQEALRDRWPTCGLLEYFVYFRWRLIKSRDIRRFIRHSNLLSVDISSCAEEKARLIRRYRSQTEVLNNWQRQPIVTAHSIAERCSEPEWFLRGDLRRPRSAIFAEKRLRILAAHYVERLGKRPKDQTVAFINWLCGHGLGKNV
jgi:LmbE family N-acetylglucosaminyl deacetylase